MPLMPPFDGVGGAAAGAPPPPCQGLAEPWYAQREREAVKAKVQ